MFVGLSFWIFLILITNNFCFLFCHLGSSSSAQNQNNQQLLLLICAKVMKFAWGEPIILYGFWDDLLRFTLAVSFFSVQGYEICVRWTHNTLWILGRPLLSYLGRVVFHSVQIFDWLSQLQCQLWRNKSFFWYSWHL